jgi:hypothetical protein
VKAPLQFAVAAAAWRSRVGRDTHNLQIVAGKPAG